MALISPRLEGRYLLLDFPGLPTLQVNAFTIDFSIHSPKRLFLKEKISDMNPWFTISVYGRAKSGLDFLDFKTDSEKEGSMKGMRLPIGFRRQFTPNTN